MKLIVGLGNPGKEYEGTRHNMGFMCVDEFMDMAGGVFDKHDFKGSYGIVRNPLFKEPIVVLKPETFMNLSGESVRPLADFYKIDPDDILIVYDEMALAEGQIRLRKKGSSGGHKGIQSVINNMGTDAIKRIRIGIGEPPHKDAVNFVLGKPSKESVPLIEEALLNGARAIRDSLLKGFDYAMNLYNGKGNNH